MNEYFFTEDIAPTLNKLRKKSHPAVLVKD